jgi:hypothetical protein
VSIERFQAIVRAGPHTDQSPQLTALTVQGTAPEASHDPCFVSNEGRCEKASACASLEHGLQAVNACHAPRTGTKIQLVAVMTNAFDFSISQYAVIEARRTDGPSERFVIAYSDERALRDLIAGPSIIGCGFATREQAQVHADVWRPLESEQPQGLPTTSRREVGRRILSAQQRLRAAFDLMEAGRIVRGFLTAANAAAILTFYSRH